MNRRVDVGAEVLEQAHEEFGADRPPEGHPSKVDFVAGPLAAAVLAFRDFDQLRYDTVSAARSYTVVDPFFGPVVFVGLLCSDGRIEIVEFARDLNYCQLLADDSDCAVGFRPAAAP